MSEGICPDHRLIGLHRKTRDLRDELGGRHDLRRVDTYLKTKVILAGTHRHDDLFQRRIASALAKTVDRALHLTRTTNHDPRERICHRHAEVVVTMHGPHRLVGIRYALAQGPEHLTVEFGYGVTDGIGKVNRRSPLVDHRLEHTAQEIHVGTAAVLGTELHIIRKLPRETDCLPRLFIDLIRRHPQLFLHV